HSRIEAESMVAREIRRFAVANGASNRYHDTLTRFWVRVMGHAIENAPEARSIDDLLARSPYLLDKSLPYRHWRAETFNSDQARSRDEFGSSLSRAGIWDDPVCIAVNDERW